MSQTHSSDRDSASRMRTRVVSPSTRKVSASAVTDDGPSSVVFSAATLAPSRWNTSQASSGSALPGCGSLPQSVSRTLGKEPGSPQAARAERVKNDSRWRFFELNTGHNLHYTAPKETVAILLELAKAPVGAAR